MNALVQLLMNKSPKNKEALRRKESFARLHYHVEKAVISHDRLYVRAWIYEEKYFSDNATVILKGIRDQKKFEQSFRVPLKRREDVRCVMGPWQYGNCGIQICVPFKECELLVLSLGLDVAGDELIVEADCEVASNLEIDYKEPTQQEAVVCLEYDDDTMPIEWMQACVNRKTTTAYNIGIVGSSWKDGQLHRLKRKIKKLYKKYGENNLNVYRIGNPLLMDSGIKQLGSFPFSMLPQVVLEYELNHLFMPEQCREMSDFKFPVSEQIEHFDCGRVAFFIDYYSYAARYRVEHFREKLQWQGISSDYYMLNEAPGVDLSVYTNIVIYRCSHVEQVAELISRARQACVHIYYDIDDYIFDYQSICELDFMQDPEYLNFKDMSEATFQCMSMADEFIVSTQQLRTAVEASFPDRQVWVSRNCASLEMYLLSEEAFKSSKVHSQEFVIGYFSGSETHNRDFELVAPVLAEIMDLYPEVKLLIVGCMSLPQCMYKFSNRIEKRNFMDWRNLPACIAETDLNIQPLQDTFFHSCKSENKWMEAALAGVPTVASSNLELKRIIRQGTDGILCTDEKEWKEALISLIEHPDEASRMGRQAHKRVVNEYLTIQNPFTGFHCEKKVL